MNTTANRCFLKKAAASFAMAATLLLSITGCDGSVAAAPLDGASPEVTEIPEELIGAPAVPVPTPTAMPAPTADAQTDAPANQDTPRPARDIDPNKPMVALTFDDGPHRTYTNAILDTLEQYGAVATFFDVGNRVEKLPETVARAYSLGCEIGSHSYSHKNLTTLSGDELTYEIKKADDAIEAATGERPTLLRPPYGKISDSVRQVAEHPLILWSVDTLDWENRDAKKTFQAIKDEGDLDGKVILMHAIRESTAEAMKDIVPWLIENGYQLVTVSEMIQVGMGDTPVNGEKYGFSYFRR